MLYYHTTNYISIIVSFIVYLSIILSFCILLGTALYRAPEQEGQLQSQGGYDFRADLYSLGVILFEMCHKPFPTGMERIIIVRALRDRYEIPVSFTDHVGEKIAKMITALVQRDPQLRPTAASLLSAYLPTRLGSSSFQHLQEITEALAAPKSDISRAVVR